MARARQDTGPPKLNDAERPVVLERITTLRSQIRGLQELTPNHHEFNTWHHAVWSLVCRYSDFATHRLSFGMLDFRNGRGTSLVLGYGESQPDPGAFDSQTYQAALLKADSILSVMIQELEDAETARKRPKVTEAGAALAPVQTLIELCGRFHRVVGQLRRRHDNRPTLDISDEYDVQDLMHALLKLSFDDIRPEEWTPSYAGGSSRMDFLLWEESIVLEVKKTRQNLRDREVGSQLIEDIARYRSHPRCKALVCFVYDPEERLQNPQALENDLSGSREGLDVRVVIEPRR